MANIVMAVIVAGLLAFSIWETITINFVGGMIVFGIFDLILIVILLGSLFGNPQSA